MKLLTKEIYPSIFSLILQKVYLFLTEDSFLLFVTKTPGNKRYLACINNNIIRLIIAVA